MFENGGDVNLVSIREAMAAYAASFDPALITASDAASVVEHAACIEKMAATVCALAAGRVAETSLWKREGDRSPAHHLARKTGKSVGDAVDTLRTAKRMDDLPESWPDPTDRHRLVPESPATPARRSIQTGPVPRAVTTATRSRVPPTSPAWLRPAGLCRP